MQPLDNEFFEMYKRLDNLCGDMYSCRHGVSKYISEMELSDILSFSSDSPCEERSVILLLSRSIPLFRVQ